MYYHQRGQEDGTKGGGMIDRERKQRTLRRDHVQCFQRQEQTRLRCRNIDVGGRGRGSNTFVRDQPPSSPAQNDWRREKIKGGWGGQREREGEPAVVFVVWVAKGRSLVDVQQ